MDISHLTTAEKWDYIYSSLGIKDFMDFLVSSDLQNSLLPLKIFFIIFTILFFCLTIYFYINSSYIKYQFSRNVSDLFSESNAEISSIDSHLRRIIKKTESGSEKDYKLSIVEADDLLQEVLREGGYKGEDFEDLVNKIGKKIMPNYEDILQDHEIRNEIVYNLDYNLDLQKAKKILDDYDSAIKNVAI